MLGRDMVRMPGWSWCLWQDYSSPQLRALRELLRPRKALKRSEALAARIASAMVPSGAGEPRWSWHSGKMSLGRMFVASDERPMQEPWSLQIGMGFGEPASGLRRQTRQSADRTCTTSGARHPRSIGPVAAVALSRRQHQKSWRTKAQSG